MQYRPASAFNSPFWTTNSGAPVWNNNASLTVGSRGDFPISPYMIYLVIIISISYGVRVDTFNFFGL